MPANKAQTIKEPKTADAVRARQRRTGLLALGVMMMAAGGATESPATMLGCEKPNADPEYCHNNEPRQVCLANGHIVWKDTQAQLSQGEYHFLSGGGRVPLTKCPQ